MMIEIGLKCRLRMEQKGINLGRALVDVLVEEKASSFFMTKSYARQLYYKMEKEKKRSN